MRSTETFVPLRGAQAGKIYWLVVGDRLAPPTGTCWPSPLAHYSYYYGFKNRISEQMTPEAYIVSPPDAHGHAVAPVDPTKGTR